MLDEVRINGAAANTVLGGQVLTAQLTFSRTQVTSLAVVAADDRDLRLTANLQQVFTDKTQVNYRDWQLKPKTVKPGGDAKNPTIQIVCTSKAVADLDKQTGGKSWGTTGVSAWAAEVITSVGATPYVQPGLGDREIERQEEKGDNADAESTWDVLAEMAKQTGAWLFEDGHRVTLAKPTWLVAQPRTRRYSIEYNTWVDHTPALCAAPGYQIDYDAKPWDGRESLTLSVIDPQAGGGVALARPGDIVHYTGAAAPADPTWLVVHVALPARRTQPTTITCWRPVDPPEIVPENPAGESGASAGVPTGPIGAAGWQGEQLKNAAEIVKEGQRRTLPTLAYELAVATAMGESSLINIGYGDAAGPDSCGLFQQRDTWGSRSDRLTPAKAAGFFYDALKATDYQGTYKNGGASIVYGGYYGPGGSGNAASVAIHNVQRNADPAHYVRFWADAQLVVKACIDAGNNTTGGAKATGPLGKRIDELMASYEGRFIDFDGAYGAQCADLTMQYCHDLFGLPMIVGNGVDYWRNRQLAGTFTPVPVGQNPRKGDIASWSGSSGAYPNGSYGHVAIYSHTEDGQHYSLTQNPGPSRVMPLSSDGVQGWMRPVRTN